MDRDSCPFYAKIGTCRHGNTCSKKHPRPDSSNTVMFQNLYPGTDLESFVEDIFIEAAQIAPVAEVLVSGNTNEHLKGNVYMAFNNAKDAEKVLDNLNTRWYAGRPVFGEFSPVHDFRTACCRDVDTGECDRGDKCNYVHPLIPNKAHIESLYASQEKTWRH